MDAVSVNQICLCVQCALYVYVCNDHHHHTQAGESSAALDRRAKIQNEEMNK